MTLPGPSRDLLVLQRLAGNAAVSELVAGRVPAVQRCAHDDPARTSQEQAAYQQAVTTGGWQAADSALTGMCELAVRARVALLSNAERAGLWAAASPAVRRAMTRQELAEARWTRAAGFMDGLDEESRTGILAQLSEDQRVQVHQHASPDRPTREAVAASDPVRVFRALVEHGHWREAVMLLGRSPEQRVGELLSYLTAFNQRYVREEARWRLLQPRAGLVDGFLAEQFGSEASLAPALAYALPGTAALAAAPGDRLLFSGRYAVQAATGQQVVLTASEGGFGAADGPNAVAVEGADADNVQLFTPTSWTSHSITVRIRFRDGPAMPYRGQTRYWIVDRRSVRPQTIQQREDAGPRPEPATYTYDVGPPQASGASYAGQTIFERFENPTYRIGLQQLVEDVRQYGQLADVLVGATLFGFGGGVNSSLVVLPGDITYDTHQGGFADEEVFRKYVLPGAGDVSVDLPQVYETASGTELARYVIRRTRHGDGSRTIAKRPAG